MQDSFGHNPCYEINKEVVKGILVISEALATGCRRMNEERFHTKKENESILQSKVLNSPISVVVPS